MMLYQIGVVIPTHDRPDDLKNALNSVVNQSLRPTKIIVVDDLGTPASEILTHELGKNYPDIEVSYHRRHGKHLGASASRNHGATVASCPWLAFLDDDDLWRADHLAELVSTQQRSGADLVIGRIAILDESGSRLGPKVRPGLQPHEVLARNPGVTGSNFLIRREAYDRIEGFDVQLPVSNDKDFFFRALKSRISYETSLEPTAIYRRHSSDALTSWNSKRGEGMRIYRDRHRSDLSRTDWCFLTSQVYSAYANSATTWLRRTAYRGASLLLYPPRIAARLRWSKNPTSHDEGSW